MDNQQISYVYISVDSKTGKKYIGSHAGKLDDNYMGSFTDCLEGFSPDKKYIYNISKNRQVSYLVEDNLVNCFGAIESDLFLNKYKVGIRDNDFSEKVSTGLNAYIQNNPEYIINKSIISKSLWEKEDYREKQRKAREVYDTPEYREKLSKSQKGKPKSEDSIKKMKESLKKKYADPTYMELAKQRSNSPETIEKLRKANIGGKNPAAKPVITPDGLFNSKSEAYNFYNISKGEFNKLMKNFPDKYYLA